MPHGVRIGVKVKGHAGSKRPAGVKKRVKVKNNFFFQIKGWFSVVAKQFTGKHNKNGP